MSSDNVIKIGRTADDERFLKPKELALRWGCSVGTLANKRAAGVGPMFTKIGSTVRYPLSGIQEYERKNTIDPGAA